MRLLKALIPVILFFSCSNENTGPDVSNIKVEFKLERLEESFFNKLAGNNIFWQQIVAGKSEDEIRKSWEPALSKFKETRKKYLLYPDFE